MEWNIEKDDSVTHEWPSPSVSPVLREETRVVFQIH